MISYTKFTFKEFRVCARAWFAFGAGYKLGERYRLGELERRHGQSADPGGLAAWLRTEHPALRKSVRGELMPAPGAGGVQTSLVGTVQGMMASARNAFRRKPGPTPGAPRCSSAVSFFWRISSISGHASLVRGLRSRI